MPEMHNNVLSWASQLDPNALAQAETSAKMPFIPGHIALMPDAHLGLGATVGSVIPTQGAIIPAAVGVDIGCGMAAVKLDVTASQLPDDLTALLDRIASVVPAGVGQGHESFHVAKVLHKLGQDHTPKMSDKQANTSARQMGTLGSGNHFVEVCLDKDENVWVVLHSGSRGIGNQLAQRHIKKAKGMMKEMFITLDDPDLAYFVQGTEEFGDYWSDLQWAQGYAAANRATMLKAILEQFREFMGGTLGWGEEINCHHNYTALENHHGKNMFITRKGAISAKAGEWGIIPGSMGTNSFIVQGLGNPASYESAPHGAGRAMSRRKAKDTFSYRDLEDRMEGKVWMSGKSDKLVDEIPDSYKDVHMVMRDSADLVEIKVELEQIINYKGT